MLNSIAYYGQKWLVKQMKRFNNLVAGVLALAICAAPLNYFSHTTRAASGVGVKPGSNLQVKNWNGKDVIIGFPEKGTVDQLLSKLENGQDLWVTKAGTVLSGNDIVSTGTMLELGTNQIPVVIKGDVNGDGAVNTTDALQIKLHLMKEFKLEGLLLLAADTSEDGVVNSTDYLQLKNYFLKKWNIYTNKNDYDKTTDLQVVKNGESAYTIVYQRDTECAAAYTLQETIKQKLGVTLPVKKTTTVSTWDKVISLTNSDKENLGNCGYAMQTSGSAVMLYAPALSGFDKAIERLMSDCAGKNTLSVPGGYLVREESTWETNYVPQGQSHNASYNAGMFYNDKNDSVAYVSNAMWHMFGAIDDGQNLVYRFGNEPTWYEWMSEKLAWSTDQQYINELKQKIQTFPQTSTGYMWSWGTTPYWKVDDCYSIHYDGTFRYIAAVYDILAWEGNTSFLNEMDPDTVAGQYSDVDSSCSRTVLQKTEACMDYILDYLYGSEGYIRLTKESTYLNSNGSKRFDYVKDTGKYCWNNTGKDGSNASNYWDNLCFGNYDGYSNALFYNALESMAGIYRMLEDVHQNNQYLPKALELEELAAKVKKKFNELYWSSTTGRYIACIDTDGRKVDYGLTFHNFEILKYGLADETKAKSILDWVDGDRTIAGENRTGADIFSYAKALELVPGTAAQEAAKWNLRLAAVTNTISINNATNQAKQVAWWHAPGGIDVWSSASYGKHLENGGYIFYPVFYELMARTEYEGAQSTTQRLREIAKVYEYNGLATDLAATGSTNWLEGLNGEFPESGLVPTAYLYGLMGFSAEYDGLHIAPKFNEGYEYMGVKKLSYGDTTYAIEVNRDATCTLTPASGKVNLKMVYTPERFQDVTYTVTVTKNNGTKVIRRVVPDENGDVYISLNENNVYKIQIVPVLR